MMPATESRPLLSQQAQTRLATISLLVAGAIFGLMSGTAAPLPYSSHRVFAAENFATLAGNAFGVCAALWLLWERCRFRFWDNAPDNPMALGIANYLLAGYVVIEIGWWLNRCYWYFFRIFSELGHKGLADWLTEHGSYVSNVSLLLVWTGITLGASPALKYYFGRWWVLVAVSYFAAAWVTGYQSPDVWRILIGCGPEKPLFDPGIGACL